MIKGVATLVVFAAGGLMTARFADSFVAIVPSAVALLVGGCMSALSVVGALALIDGWKATKE